MREKAGGFLLYDNWVTDKNTGQPVNLIDSKDRTGLEMAEHKQ